MLLKFKYFIHYLATSVSPMNLFLMFSSCDVSAINLSLDETDMVKDRQVIWRIPEEDWPEDGQLQERTWVRNPA